MWRGHPPFALVDEGGESTGDVTVASARIQLSWCAAPPPCACDVPHASYIAVVVSIYRLVPGPPGRVQSGTRGERRRALLDVTGLASERLGTPCCARLAPNEGDDVRLSRRRSVPNVPVLALDRDCIGAGGGPEATSPDPNLGPT
jgi:hypothetical protein